jgi:uncharacterized repeat protein (TIGR03803 family)
MRISRFGRYTLCGCVAAAMLAGCGVSQPSLSPSVAQLTRERFGRNVAYRVLLNFTGTNGEYPEASLISVNDTLYGTTYDGGQNSLGTVFAITPSGTQTIVYNFKGGPKDGALPEAGLIDVNGTLLGTSGGGAKGIGTVFEVTTSGNETILHSFKGGSGDGSFPVAGLVDVNGTVYGTTLHGGGAGCRTRGPTSGCGTIFSIATSGMETVLHQFAGGSKDGEYPEAGLVNVDGTLYGTTPFGGGVGCRDVHGCGTIFAITPSGNETIIHNFGRAGDGANPQATLLNVDGTLYGTTHGGGRYNLGTVFKFTPSGNESVLYSFKGARRGKDGAEPVAGLINSNGTFYGTTYSGGANCADGRGCGTVFAVSTSGAETILYRFKDHNEDGAAPKAGLIDQGNTLYGTSYRGGTGGYGTVFLLSL